MVSPVHNEETSAEDQLNDADVSTIDGIITAMYECIIDWTDTDGKDHHLEEVSVQTWKNGKIVLERFYYHA